MTPHFLYDPGGTLTNGLVAHYLDRVSYLIDTWGANNLTKTGSVSIAPGKLGMGASFPGVNGNYLHMPYAITASTSFSVAMWVDLLSDSLCGMFCKVGAGTTGWGIGVGATTAEVGGTPGNHLIGLSETFAWKNFNVNIGTGKHFVVMTKQNGGSWIGYIDSVACPTTFTGAFNTPTVETGIGSSTDGLRVVPFVGNQVLFYERVLTPTEIIYLYNGGAGNPLLFDSFPKLLGVDLAVPTYSWSAGENTAKPLVNLKTYYPDHISGSNGTGDNQYLLIDFGAPVTCSKLVIQGHNFTALGLPREKISLQVNTDDDGNFADAETVTDTVSVATDPLEATFDETTKRYWRLLFSKGSALSVAPEAGNIFLGSSLNFESTQEWNFYTDMPDFINNQVRTSEGRIQSAEHYGIARHEMEFKLHSDAFVVLWRAFLRTVKQNGRPFYYIDNRSNVWLVNFEKGFNPAKAMSYNKNDIPRFTLVSTMGE